MSYFQPKPFSVRDGNPTWGIGPADAQFIGWQGNIVGALEDVFIKCTVSRSVFHQYTTSISPELVCPIEGHSVYLYAKYTNIEHLQANRLTVYFDSWNLETANVVLGYFEIIVDGEHRSNRGLHGLFRNNLRTPLSQFSVESGNTFGRFINTPSMTVRYANLQNGDNRALFDKIIADNRGSLLSCLEIPAAPPAVAHQLYMYPWMGVYGPEARVPRTPNLGKTNLLIENGSIGNLKVHPGVSKLANSNPYTVSSMTNKTTMGIWMNTPRFPSQEALIGFPANALAAAIECGSIILDDSKVTFEWLHLVAHRFGILLPGNDTTSNPQNYLNLVFGTSAANTQMLMLENQISRCLYDDANVNAEIRVCTTPLAHTDAKAPPYNFLSTQIAYNFTLTKGGTPLYSGNYIFGPVSAYCPSLHENLMYNPFFSGYNKALPPAPIPGPALAPAPAPFGGNVSATVRRGDYSGIEFLGYKFENAAVCNVIGNRIVPITAKGKFTTRLVGNSGSVTGDNPGGTILTGTLNGFGGNSVKTNLAVMDDGNIYGALAVPDNFTLDQIFDNLSCSDLNLYVLNNVNISYADNKLIVNGKLDMSKEPLSMIKPLLPEEFEVFIKGEMQLASSSTKLKPEYFVLSTVAEFSIPIMDGVKLKSGKLSIMMEPEINTITMERSWRIRPMICGKLEISGISKKPLEIECSISYNNNTLTLNAICNEAEDFFGVDGLTVNGVQLQVNLGRNNNMSLAASFDVGLTGIAVGGTFGGSGAGIFGSAENFTLLDLDNIYYNLSGNHLSLPDYDITFDSVKLAVATNDCSVFGFAMKKGLTLACDITVHDFSCGAEVNISTDGISVKGFLKNVSIGTVDIDEAVLRLGFYKQSSGKQSEFTIEGKASFCGMILSCCVSCLKNGESWSFLVAAKLEAESFGISTLFPALANTFMDSFRFSEVGFLYATKDTQYDGKLLRSGLTLAGTMNHIEALEVIGCAGPYELAVHMGEQTDFSLSMPNTQIDLGSRVKCDPFTVKIAISPTPSFALVFGMNLSIDGQNEPLHFDLVLDIGALEAKGSATMKNWWVNPFGISENLKIGPAVALEIGIIYAQFASTGLPSTFGIAGGMQIGDVNMQMAVKISENPSQEILMGSISKLTVKDLVSFASAVTSLSLPAADVPDFFSLEDFLLYFAPSGGRIGTIVYERGISFSSKLTLFGKTAQVAARIANEGITASGSIDKLELGPLAVGGKNEDDLSFDMALTSKEQQFKFDGEISIFGLDIGAYVVLSKKEVVFDFEMDFLEMLTYRVKGTSIGSYTDIQNLDFQLSAVMENGIIDYLEDIITGKIQNAIQDVNKSIAEAQAEVSRAKEAYHKLYEPAMAALEKAQEDADRYLEKCKKDLKTAKEDFTKDVEAAEKNVADAKKAYDDAIADARRLVESTKEQYDKEVDAARAEVDRAEKEYNRAMGKAQDAFNRAQNEYNKAFDAAKSKLDDAQREVDKIFKEIRSAEARLSDLSWLLYPVLGPVYATEIAALYATYGIATGILRTAEAFLSGVETGSEYTAWLAAKTALEAVKTGVEWTAFESAKAALEYAIKQGAGYLAYNAAKIALESIKTGSEWMIWNNAINALETVKVSGRKAVDAAQLLIDKIARSAVYIALEQAKQAVKALRTTSEFIAFDTALCVLEAVRISTVSVLKLAEFIKHYAGDILNVKAIRLSASLKDIKAGQLFVAEIEAVIFGKTFNITMDFNVVSIWDFIDALFKEVLKHAYEILPV